MALRIGWCLYDDPTELAGTQYEAYLRAMWLSRRDWEGFALAALARELRNGYIVAYAVSNNSTRSFDIEESVRLLGYSPQDSSDDFDWSRPAPAPAPAPDDDGQSIISTSTIYTRLNTFKTPKPGSKKL